MRKADLFGQIENPNRLCKCPALFHEFQEISLNKKLGYKIPGDQNTGAGEGSRIS